MLNDKYVAEGDVISEKNVSSLRFVPASKNVVKSNFTLSVTNASYDYPIECKICILKEINYSPVILMKKETVKTFKNISLFASLKASDPENDSLIYAVVSFPEHGMLEIDASNSGAYLYTPYTDYTGKDSFEYIVFDAYGNCAGKDKVNIKVEKNSSGVSFEDMDGHWAYNSAIRMNEKGIMLSEVSNGKQCFYPANEVSRVEFLVMAMKAAGIGSGATCIDTGFADNSDIALSARGYVASSLENGYIKGVEVDGKQYFYPNNPITRAEAAVILNNILDLATPVSTLSFPDLGSIPVWAKGAVNALAYEKLLNGNEEGYITPLTTITRGQCAVLLDKVCQYKK